MLMNKTIKQAERYEAPEVKFFAIEMTSRIMNVSGETPDLSQEYSDWD